MKKVIVLIGLVVLSLSCEKDEPCGEASTGPPSFSVEIIDKNTNENVFSNGTYTQNQLKVTTENSTTANYRFISENNMNIIGISPAWQEGTFTTIITLNNQISIPIESKIYKSSSKCYENYFIESLNVIGYSYTYDETTGIYKIKISYLCTLNNTIKNEFRYFKKICHARCFCFKRRCTQRHKKH